MRCTLDAPATTETTFFRDAGAFNVLAAFVLPALIARRRQSRTLRFWSAACSTGQEPYSMAIAIAEHYPELASWDVSILGTDISRQALARACAGVYSRTEVDRGVPSRVLSTYFIRRGDTWSVVPSIARRVSFAYLDLTRPWPASLPVFDVIFVRNALIYFDASASRRILHQAHGHLRPDGHFFLGAGESPDGLDDLFVRIMSDRAGGDPPVYAKAR